MTGLIVTQASIICIFLNGKGILRLSFVFGFKKLDQMAFLATVTYSGWDRFKKVEQVWKKGGWMFVGQLLNFYLKTEP